jgi:molecular chaperone DnaK
MPQIEVAFDIDANGILHVSARDKTTGKEAKITIKANSGLSEEEVQRMVKDAEVNAAEDRRKLEVITARNQLDGLVHSVRKSLEEHGAKLSAEDKTSIEAALAAADEALKTEDKEKLEAQSQALGQAAQKLGELMQAEQQAAAGAAAGAAGAAGGEPGARPKDDDVVDAEFTEVKDRK